MYTSALERVVKTEDKYGSKHCSGSALLSTGSIIKHSLNNGAVLTMENKVLPNALMLGGFVHCKEEQAASTHISAIKRKQIL